MSAHEIEYRDIPGFPDYRATSLGTIESRRRKGPRCDGRSINENWKKLGLSVGKSNYLYACLSAGGVRVTKTAHRLICLAFHGPCPNGMQCCHSDGNKLNNAPSNLRWDTPQSNYADRDRHGTTMRGDAHYKRKLHSSDLNEIRRLRADGLTQKQIADRFGVSRSTIGYIVTNKIWKSVPEVAPPCR